MTILNTCTKKSGSLLNTPRMLCMILSDWKTTWMKCNAVDNERENNLKQSSNDCGKTLAADKEYNTLENSQPEIENLDYRED